MEKVLGPRKPKDSTALLAITAKQSSSMSKDFSLICATKFGHVAIIKLLLEDGRINPNTKDIFAGTALHWDIKLQHNEVVEILLGYESVDPEIENSDYESPLYLAVIYENINALKLLLKRGVRVVRAGNNRMCLTALDFAEVTGKQEMVKLLEEYMRKNNDALLDKVDLSGLFENA